MTLANLCVVLLVLWTLLAYVAIPLPFEDPFFAWLRRQWLMEGIAGLTFLGVISAVCSQWRRRTPASIVPWWSVWWVWMGWVAASLVYSIDRGASLRSGLAWLSYGLLAYLACALVRSPSDLILWVRFLVGIAIVASLEGFFQYSRTFEATLPLLERLQGSGQLDLQGWGGAVIKDFLLRKRITSVFGWPNLFAGFLLLVIPPAVSLSFQSPHRGGRCGWAVASGLLSLCLILTLSMGGWIAAIFTGSLAWLLLRAPKRAGGRRLAGRPATVLLLGCLVVLIVCITSFIVAKRARPFIAASVSSRTIYAQGAMNVLRAHPFLGTGAGTFGLAYRSLMPREQFEGQHSAQHAHNTVLEFGAELGLIGMVCFAMFLWQVGRLLAAAIRGPTDAGALLLRRGLAIGLLGFFIHSLLEQTFVESVTAPFWWITLGLLTGASRAERPASSARWHVALPLIAACLGLAAVSRLALADGWAARGAWLDLSDQSQEATVAFARAQRWDPLASRYPIEQGKRFLKRISTAPPDQARPLLERAKQQFERAAQLSPWLSAAWFHLGVVNWRMGRVDEAIRAMREAVRRDPNSRTALAQLAQMLGAAGQFSELQQVAAMLQRLEPLSPAGWFWEALAWQDLQQPARAAQTYRALLSRFPDHYSSAFNLAELLRAQGNIEEAMRTYQTFLQIAPEQERVRRARAQAFLREAESLRAR